MVSCTGRMLRHPHSAVLPRDLGIPAALKAMGWHGGLVALPWHTWVWFLCGQSCLCQLLSGALWGHRCPDPSGVPAFLGSQRPRLLELLGALPVFPAQGRAEHPVIH